MKSIKERLNQLKQKKLNFATKQWIIIIVSVLIGACLSNWDDYLYRNNDVGRWIGLIGDHHVEGMYRGFQFALAVVLINIISRILKDKRVLKQPKELKAATIIGITALGLFAVVFWIDACYSALHPMSEDDPLLFWARAFFLFILVKVIRTIYRCCKHIFR